MSAYLAFTAKHPTLFISPCHEKFECTHINQDKRVCVESCSHIKEYRARIDSVFRTGTAYIPELTAVDVDDEYLVCQFAPAYMGQPVSFS